MRVKGDAVMRAKDTRVVKLCDSNRKSKWENNPKEWTGLPLKEIQSKANDREEWRNMVDISWLAPQGFNKLMDTYKWRIEELMNIINKTFGLYDGTF